MTTAKYRCSACGEPLIRPVLSCPYCGAFRSAVPLEEMADTDTAAPAGAATSPHPESVPEGSTETPPTQGVRRIQPDDRARGAAPAEPSPPPAAADEWPDLGPGPQAPAPEPEQKPADDDDWGLPPPPPLRAQSRPREEPQRDATLRTVPRPPRSGRPGENRGSRRNEPKVSAPDRDEKARPRTRKVGELGRRGSPEPDQAHEAPNVPDDAPEERKAEAPRAVRPVKDDSVAPEGEGRRARRRRASAQRRAHGPHRVAPEVEPAPRGRKAPPVEDTDWDDADAYDEADDHAIVPGADELLATPYRERRRRGRGGWIAFLIVLIIFFGAIGGGVYWVNQMGLMSLLAPNSLRVTSFGEASSVEVSTSWTTVRDPSAGGAVGMLLNASGPFRIRVDGTVYTLAGDSSVRVPVKPGTVLELRGRDGPVTVNITRLGEEPAEQ
ncbi:hypothetical protein [Amorphus sp. 3PC139-8]|uniref:hypothetical protein n=1 Tax=Amorphus sp. 3PC139-8 TaxID=2735676 RepID=UPI00345DD780